MVKIYLMQAILVQPTNVIRSWKNSTNIRYPLLCIHALVQYLMTSKFHLIAFDIMKVIMLAMMLLGPLCLNHQI